jgi:hypothetical protein
MSNTQVFLKGNLPYQVCQDCKGTGDAQASHGSAPFCVTCFGSGNEPIFEGRYAHLSARYQSDGHGCVEGNTEGTERPAKASNRFANKFGGKCFKCGQWLDAGAGYCTRDGQKWVVEHKECPPAPVQGPRVVPTQTGLDLSTLPSGRSAVPGGDTRLKVQIDGVAGGKWDGWVFVKDAAEYGQGTRYGSQRPGELYRGKIEDALRAIAADPKAAAIAYGKLTGHCCLCNRTLEAEGSVEAGIGPICAGKVGWVG